VAGRAAPRSGLPGAPCNGGRAARASLAATSRISFATRFGGSVAARLKLSLLGILALSIPWAACDKDASRPPSSTGQLSVLLIWPDEAKDSLPVSPGPGATSVPQIDRIDLLVHRVRDGIENRLAMTGTDVAEGQTTFRIEVEIPQGESTSVRVAARGAIVGEPDPPEPGYLYFGGSAPFTLGPDPATVRVSMLPFYPQQVQATGTLARGHSIQWTCPCGGPDHRYRVAGWPSEGAPRDTIVSETSVVFRPWSSGTMPGFMIYRVQSLNGYFESALSDSVLVRGRPTVDPPSSVSAGRHPLGGIHVAWTDQSNNEDGFLIGRQGPQGGEYVSVASTARDVTSFLDEGPFVPGGRYTYRVQAFLGQEVSPPAYSSAVGLAPDPPTLPAAQALGTDRIRCSWAAPAAGYADSVWIERQAPEGAPLIVGRVPETIRQYVDQGLEPRTIYTYRYYSRIHSLPSLPTAPVEARTWPPAPAGLEAQTLSESSIRLSWNYPSPDPDSFRVMRRRAEEPIWVRIATLAGSARGHDDAGLDSRTTYHYELSALDHGDPSPPSEPYSARTLPPPPSDLTARVSGPASLEVGWSYPASNPDGFEIEMRRYGETTWEEVASVPGSLRAAAVSDLLQRTTYQIRMRAFEGQRHSDYSETAEGATPPPAPASFAGLWDPIEIGVELAWIFDGDHPESFELESRLAETTDWASYAGNPISGSSRTAQAPSVEVNRVYEYRIRAIDRFASGADTVASGWATDTVMTDLSPPSAPSGLEAGAGGLAIELQWRASEGIVAGYEIERRRQQDPSYTYLATVSSGITEHTDEPLAPARRYTYRARAYNAAGYSGYSNETAGYTSGWRRIQVSGVAPGYRRGHAGAWDSDNSKILIYGGGASPAEQQELWEFDPSDSSWVHLDYAGLHQPGARYRAAMAYSSRDGVFYLDGGSPWSTTYGSWFFNRNTLSWDWSCAGDGPPTTRSHEGPATAWVDLLRSFFSFGGGRNLLRGVDSKTDVYKIDFRSYRPGDDYCGELPGIVEPPERAGCALFATGGSELLLFGGQNEFGYLNDLWSLDAASVDRPWSARSAAGMPPSPRAYADAAINSALGRIYILGGYLGPETPTTDFYRLDTAGMTLTWSRIHPALEPGVECPNASGSILVVDPPSGFLYHLGPGATAIEVWLYVP